MILRLVAPAGGTLSREVRVASGPFARGRGLLGHPEPNGQEALLLPGARQIHTFGMRYPIDVIFCDREGRVLRVCRGLRPLRITRPMMRSRWVLEMRAGAADGVKQGDRLTLVQSAPSESPR